MFEKFIMSSADPAKVSVTIKGLLTAILPIIIMVSGAKEADVNMLVDAIVNVAFYGMSLVSAGITIYGLMRKLAMGRWSAFESKDNIQMPD